MVTIPEFVELISQKIDIQTDVNSLRKKQTAIQNEITKYNGNLLQTEKRLTELDMDLTAAERKATYEEIKKYVAKHNDGMKVSNLYIAQIKQKHGIIERENYNKPKSEKGGQPECPKEKEIAIEEALKYFQMIPSES